MLSTYFRGQVKQFVRAAEASVSQKRQDDFLWQKNAEEGWLKITKEWSDTQKVQSPRLGSSLYNRRQYYISMTYTNALAK